MTYLAAWKTSFLNLQSNFKIRYITCVNQDRITRKLEKEKELLEKHFLKNNIKTAISNYFYPVQNSFKVKL